MIVAIMLSISVHANVCKNYFSNLYSLQNLHPKDETGEYYEGFSKYQRARIQNRAVRSSRILQPILIAENSHKKAYALSPNHLVIENTRQKTTYDFESTLPIHGRFSLKGSAWIIVHKNLDIPKIQIWRFTRIQGNLIEIPLDRMFDTDLPVQISEKINPLNGHEIMTVLYEGYAQGRDQMLMIILDLNTGLIQYHGPATLETVEFND